MADGLTPRLADFALSPVDDPAALAMLRLSLFDWAACGIAGASEPVAKLVRAMVLDETGNTGLGEAALFGDPARVPARGAALVNGTASHALDYDDTHFGHIGHPSVAVLPAALAVAQRVGADGGVFLQAGLIGAELSIRVGQWLGRAHYQAGFHQTATAGSFGAAAAAARLLGCDRAQMAQALGLVSTRAAGLKSQFGTMGKPYHAGLAAAAGVEAALLAKAGFQGRADGLDCPQGFGPTHAGEADPTALDGLGAEYRFLTISHKFHACCHGTHAALEALAELADGDPAEIERVEIAIHPRWRAVCDIACPETALEAKFSYRLTAAMALAGRDTSALASFSAAACRDPALLRLRDRVTVTDDATLADTAARVAVTRAGTIRRAAHDLAAPIPPEVRAAKLRAKAAALLGDARAARLWAATEAPDLAALMHEISTPSA